MIAFRGKKKGWATPRLVSFRGLIQKFRRASSPLSFGSPPPGGGLQKARLSCLFVFSFSLRMWTIFFLISFCVLMQQKLQVVVPSFWLFWFQPACGCSLKYISFVANGIGTESSLFFVKQRKQKTSASSHLQFMTPFTLCPFMLMSLMSCQYFGFDQVTTVLSVKSFPCLASPAYQHLSRATNDAGFLLNTLKTLFRLSRVLLDHYKWILSLDLSSHPKAT